jgi:2-oxoglutarate ferredoxin oxidoreductase subunit gamma
MKHAEKIILAGFGGQGILSMGQVLSYAAVIEGKETTWMPSYGPEMRGGTANCIVIVSDTKISSPIISKFDSGIIYNQPSLEKFEAGIIPGGYLFYEESTVINPPTRTDITCIKIASIKEAELMQKKQVANMIMLGAFLEVRKVVSIESVLQALKKVLPERHHHLIPTNEKALMLGKALAGKQLQTVG